MALHELSHALMALLLGVRVKRMSLIPQRQAKGVVRLGSVEVLRSDPLRASLIGGAPLLTGMLVLGLVGLAGVQWRRLDALAGTRAT